MTTLVKYSQQFMIYVISIFNRGTIWHGLNGNKIGFPYKFFLRHKKSNWKTGFIEHCLESIQKFCITTPTFFLPAFPWLHLHEMTSWTKILFQ